MRVSAKMMWLAVVMVGVVCGSGAVLLPGTLARNPPLVPLGLIVLQMAALLLPMYRSREPRVDAKPLRQGDSRGPR